MSSRTIAEVLETPIEERHEVIVAGGVHRRRRRWRQLSCAAS
ncbi:MAG: hypothetical protein QGH73_14330 [Rhodospirillales bacterium]|nr:hypothetical protein [Rhodospirillales bacterium]MDP6644513.1 hypothetical protein [Rhodospirillales bacterium]MDP6842845.1 hypothetical protein [Rhodospirillales bacterium]